MKHRRFQGHIQQMRREELLQALLDLFEAPTYLEIGVSRGVTFHAIGATKKVAVDPRFRFDIDKARELNTTASYHEVTSDEYFGTIIDPQTQFDVIYLDGLHTAEQTLRDFTNALQFLKPTGVIVVDDVIPSSYEASLPSQPTVKILRRARGEDSREWMGDVYRIVFFIDTFFQQITFATSDDNHGQLIAWRGRRASVRERTIENIGRLPYETVVLETDVFRRRPFKQILAEIQQPPGAANDSELRTKL